MEMELNSLISTRGFAGFKAHGGAASSQDAAKLVAVGRQPNVVLNTAPWVLFAQKRKNSKTNQSSFYLRF